MNTKLYDGYSITNHNSFKEYYLLLQVNYNSIDIFYFIAFNDKNINNYKVLDISLSLKTIEDYFQSYKESDFEDYKYYLKNVNSYPFQLNENFQEHINSLSNN